MSYVSNRQFICPVGGHHHSADGLPAQYQSHRRRAASRPLGRTGRASQGRQSHRPVNPSPPRHAVRYRAPGRVKQAQTRADKHPPNRMARRLFRRGVSEPSVMLAQMFWTPGYEMTFEVHGQSYSALPHRSGGVSQSPNRRTVDRHRRDDHLVDRATTARKWIAALWQRSARKRWHLAIAAGR